MGMEWSKKGADQGPIATVLAHSKATAIMDLLYRGHRH